MNQDVCAESSPRKNKKMLKVKSKKVDSIEEVLRAEIVELKEKFAKFIDPENPPEKYIILKQAEDGNWNGWMKKYGKTIHERQYEPHTVVDYLITHA